MTGKVAVIDRSTHEPSDKTACAMCLSHDAPFIEVRIPLGKGTYSLFCIPCVAKAIQNATGWKVLNTFSQWRLQQVTGAKTQAYKAAIREAALRGEPVPERPDDVWKPRTHH